jgi:hypothetical protein
VRWWEDAQTKRTRTRPWCGDDVNVLGWGVLTPQAMVQAMRPDAMVDTLCSQIIYSQEGFGGLVQFLRIIRRVQSHANKYPLNLYTTSQRTSWAFLAGKKHKVFFSRHHGTKHHTC